MANLMEFSNRAGVELYEKLVERAAKELPEATNFDTFTAMLGATMSATANVLRGPLEAGMDAEEALNFSTRWLRTLLQPAMGKGEESSVP